MKPIEAGPGWIRLKGQLYTIPAPTPSDLQRVAEKMRDLAIPACTNPLLAVNAVAKQLDPAVLDRLLLAAGRETWGGGVEPHPDAIARQYGSLAGVRFQFWYLATREASQKSLTLDKVEDLVTENDRYDLADAIGVAASPPSKEKDDPKPLPTGAN